MPTTMQSMEAFADPPSGKEAKYPWLKEFKRRRHEGATDCAELKRRAVENHRFAAPGEEQHPYDPHDDRGSGGRRRKKFMLMSANEVHPTLSAMSGRQVMSRFERRYIPRRRELRPWAEKFSDYDRAVVDACHADQEESLAFRNGPGIAGVSWMRVSADYLEDPDGKLVIEEVSLWNMLWPAKEARKTNLLDRDWHTHGEWYRVSKFKAMWPDKVEVVKEAIGRAPSWEEDNSVRAKGSPTPWDGKPGSSWTEDDFSFFDPKEKQIWVERYEWREPEMRVFVVVPPEGATYSALDEAGLTRDQMNELVEDMSPKDFRAFVRQTQQLYQEDVPANRYIRKERMVYRYAYVAGDVVLEEGEIPVGAFTYEAMTAYPFTQPSKVDWRSVTDAMRTPQIWYNIFLTMLAKYMQVNPKGVLFVERGVFRSRSEGLRQFSSTGGLVEFERGKLSGSPNPPYRFESGGPSPMQGLVQSMLGFAQELLPRSAGFNQGALGQLGPDLRRISGAVVEHVREAAVAAHAELYDSFSLCRQRVGVLILLFLGKVLGIEHMKRVVGDEAFMEEVLDPTTGEPVSDPQMLQQLIAAGQLDPQEIVQGQPGEPFMRRIEPPEGLLDDAIWSVSVEETKPAPDRMRFFWESLSESGALQAMLTPDAQGVQALTAEDVAELAPDIPEDRREKMLQRMKMQRAAFAAQQQQAQQASAEGQQPPEQQPMM